MGEVFLKYRIMPDGPEVDLEKLEGDLKAAMPEWAQVQNCTAVPFAFGMKSLETGFVVEDEEGRNDELEGIVTSVVGVQGAELLEMARL